MNKKWGIGIILGALIMAAGSGAWFFYHRDTSQPPTRKVTITVMSASFSSYTVYIAYENGWFADEGLDVTLTPYPDGRTSLNEIMGGKADLGTCSETPFMRAVRGGGNLYAVATMLTGDKHLAVVARQDRGISVPTDLSGKSVGVTLGSNGEYFLDTVLLLNGMSMGQIAPVHLKPSHMYDALINGAVDAIATWNPQMLKAKKALGDQGRVFYAGGLYSPFFLLAGNRNFVEKNPDVIVRVLRALERASQFIIRHRDEARKIVAPYLKMDASTFEHMVATYSFNLQLSQSFLKTLVNQSKWDMKKTSSGKQAIPNFLDYLYMDALSSVNPEAVTVIR